MKMKYLSALLAGAALCLNGAAAADQWTDEANRQATMSRMAAQDAANDRAAADRAFQSGLASQRSAMGSSYGGTASASSGGSGTFLDGFASAHGGEPLPAGPQSVVARKTVIVQLKESPAQVVARLEGEAKAGNAQSAYDLARVLWTGYGGVARDDAGARRWFGIAANAGNRDAQAQYGYMLYNGVGGAADETAGLAKLAAAAEAGDPYAAGLQALYTLDLKSERPQPDKIAGLTKAADAGYLFAQVALGTIVYEYGVGAPANDALAAKYAGLAAERGHPLGQVQYGRMLMSGRGVTKDAAAGAALARKAAESGHPEGMRLYGQALGQGIGVPKDQDGGLAWMRKAADKGDPMAAGIMGMALIGSGRPADDAAAIAYFRYAASKGDLQSQAALGTFMIQGAFGVTQDKAGGARMLRAAAAAGNEDAKDTLASPEIAEAIRGL